VHFDKLEMCQRDTPKSRLVEDGGVDSTSPQGKTVVQSETESDGNTHTLPRLTTIPDTASTMTSNQPLHTILENEEEVGDDVAERRKRPNVKLTNFVRDVNTGRMAEIANNKLLPASGLFSCPLCQQDFASHRV
jgi:hypothetical protein